MQRMCFILNWTILLQIITVLVAILSPTFTAIINNRYALKMEKEKFIRTERKQIFHDYLTATSIYITHSNLTEKMHYLELKELVFLYTSEPIWNEIEKLDGFVKNHNTENAHEQLSYLSKLLAKDLRQ